tara:strand:+ start:27194 stop:28201 length:1008 start_codon:yes stop_codon:yes gene_type:complete
MTSKNKWHLNNTTDHTDLRIPLRPNRGKNLPLFSALISLTSVFFSSGTHALDDATTYENSYTFNLQGIVVHGGKSLMDSDTLQNINNQYIGKEIGMLDIKNISDTISKYYASQDMKNAKVSIQLPKIGSQKLHIFIKEPYSFHKKTQDTALIGAINFTGNITAPHEGILSIADSYVNQPYSLVLMMQLKKDLKAHYTKNNMMSPIISLPEFETSTGDVYINIIENASKPDTSLTSDNTPLIKLVQEELPQKEAVQPTIQHEVSRGIFLKAPAPKGWEEPEPTFPIKSKSTTPSIKKKADIAPLQKKKPVTVKTEQTTAPIINHSAEKKQNHRQIQ